MSHVRWALYSGPFEVGLYFFDTDHIPTCFPGHQRMPVWVSMWILNVCSGFTHNNDTEKNKINKMFQELAQNC